MAAESPPRPPRDPAAAASCWLVTERHAGMRNQCIGLAEALGLEWTVKQVEARRPWVYLPPALWWRPLRRSVSGAAFEPPWPAVVISCGRRSEAAAMALRHAGNGGTFAIHIQQPHAPARRFDVVAVPRHDRLRGDNVIVTRGALHRVTRQRLAAAAERFAPLLGGLPRPLVAVLVGGSNRRQRMTGRVVVDLADKLLRLAGEQRAGLAVTTSRRTGEANERLLRQRLRGPSAWVWDGRGENPYFGMLALADAIVVTNDSVTMASEACATGKPVHVYALAGASRRLRAFYSGLERDGITRPFTGRLEQWSYPPLDEVAAVAAAIRERMRASPPPTEQVS